MLRKISIIFSLLLISSCTKKELKQSKEAPLKYRKISVEGVECKYCAQAAVGRIEKIEGVKRADFVCNHDKWEQGYVRIFSTEDVTDQAINQELAKEGFKIKANLKSS